MTNTTIKNGLIAGFLASLAMLGIPWMQHDTSSQTWGMVLGYTSMLLSFVWIWHCIKRSKPQGVFTWKQGFVQALILVAMAATIYVLTWQCINYWVIPNYIDVYFHQALTELQQQHLPKAQYEAKVAEYQSMIAFYKTPWGNVLMTYMEILPPGILAAAVIGWIHRRKA